jgi:hypothetical protein
MKAWTSPSIGLALVWRPILYCSMAGGREYRKTLESKNIWKL